MLYSLHVHSHKEEHMTPVDIAAFSSVFSPFPAGHPWDYVQHFLAGLLACPSMYCLLRLFRIPKVFAYSLAFGPPALFLAWKEMQDVQAGDSVGWIGDGISDLAGLSLALCIVLFAPRLKDAHKHRGRLSYIVF